MSDDFLTPEQKEILDIITAKAGCSQEYIYNKCGLEKIELARVLHKLTQLCYIFKSNGGYFAISVSEEDVADYEKKKAKELEDKIASSLNIKQIKKEVKTEEVVVVIPAISKKEKHPWKETGETIKAKIQGKKAKVEEEENKKELTSIVKTKPVEIETIVKSEPKAMIDNHIRIGPTTQTIAPKVKPLPDSRNYGNMNRGTVAGIIAMFFYENRNTEYSYSVANIVNALEGLVNLGKNPATIIYGLATKGYIEKVNNDYKKFYKWTNKIMYPFSMMLPNDEFIIPKSAKNESLTTAEITTTKEPGIIESLPPETIVETKSATIVKECKDVPNTLPSDDLDTILGLSTPSKNEVALAMLSLRINALKAELTGLEVMRNLLQEK